MRPTRSIAGACALALLALTASASAQSKDDRYRYTFEPDDLMGETFGAPPPLLRVPPKGRRVMLIRPRVSFVVELLESVEVM
jgi:hypothetical protein